MPPDPKTGGVLCSTLLLREKKGIGKAVNVIVLMLCKPLNRDMLGIRWRKENITVSKGCVL